MGIDPGIVRRVDGKGDIAYVEFGKPGFERIRVQRIDARAERSLHMVIGFHLRVTAVIGDKQISPAPEADIGRCAIDRHRLIEAGVDLEPVLRHRDVFRKAEQLADAAIGRRRCRASVRRIRLDDDDVPGPAGAAQEVGNGRAYYAAADDDDVCLLQSAFRSKLVNISPSQSSWISAGSGTRGLGFNFSAIKTYGRAEAYIDCGNHVVFNRIFDQLFRQKNAIEKEFGDVLVWERLDGKRGCRIKTERHRSIFDREQWQDPRLAVFLPRQ